MRLSKFVMLIGVAAHAGASLAADCAPQRVVRIVTADASPSLPADHWARLPKTLYRVGSKFARIEEQPDPENGIHGLIVVNAPDSWIVNLEDGTGQHVVDPDTEPQVRAPILHKEGWPESFPAEFEDLEFGCEMAFFTERGSPVTQFSDPKVTMVKQAYGIGIWKLVLVRETGARVPNALFLFQNDDIVFALKYLEYAQLAGTDMRLFDKPEGVEYVEHGPPS